MRRVVLILSSLCALALVVAACTDEPVTTAPDLASEAQLASMSVGPSAAESGGSLFGPEVFTRGRGKPRVESRSIPVVGFGPPFTLHVRNGDAVGGRRVSSARISINGRQVLGPSDFSRKVSGQARPVELTDRSVLSVELASAPGSELTIWIEGIALAQEVEISPVEVSLSSLGATRSLTATVLDVTGSPVEDAAVEWSTSDEGIATVDANGLVTAVGNGEATITALSGGASGSTDVTVSQLPALVEVAPGNITLEVTGDTAQLGATVRDAGGTEIVGAAVTWSSSDEAVATVDGEGMVTAVAAGSAAIAATSGDVIGTANVNVALLATAVEIDPGALSLASFGATGQLSAAVLDGSGVAIEAAEVAWISSDETVATVNGDGLVTAIGNGDATVTATSSAASATAQVTVQQVAATVQVEPADITLTSLGSTAPLGATVRDDLGVVIAGAAVEWVSSDGSVASIDDSGTVTAVSAGEAEITATSGAASGTAHVSVGLVAASVEVTPSTIGLDYFGDTASLSALVRDGSGAPLPDAPVGWMSSNPSVATVDVAGVVTGVGNGTVTITGTSGPASGTAQVTVAQVPIVITVFPEEITLTAVGQTTPIAANVWHGGAGIITGASVTWTSSNESVATVDANGLVTAVSSGFATITAMHESLSADVRVTVTLADLLVDDVSSIATTYVIGALSTQSPVTVVNPTGETSVNVAIQTTIVQGAAIRDAGSRRVFCGSNAGILPPGACVTNASVRATDATFGTGTLVPGPAQLQVYLTRVGSGELLSGVVTVPINLVGG